MSMTSRSPSNFTAWRSSFPFPGKSSQAPSVTTVFAEPQQSTPPRGAAVSELSSRMSFGNEQSRKRERYSSSEVSEDISDEADVLKDPSPGLEENDGAAPCKKPRTNSMEFSGSGAGCSHEEANREMNTGAKVLNSRPSWFYFVRSPSKPGLAGPSPVHSENPTAITEANSLDRTSDLRDADALRVVPIPVAPAKTSLCEANTEPIKSRPPAQGWFASFSRSQKRLPSLEATEDIPTSEPHESKEHYFPHIANSDATSEIAGPSTSDKQQAIWSAPQTPAQDHLTDNASRSSLPLIPGDNTSITPATLEGISGHASTQISGVKSLTPNSTRFTLNVPLLTRPKVSPGDPTTDTDEQLTEEIRQADTTCTAVPTIPESELSVSEPTVLSPEDLSTTDNKTSSSTWWDYISFGYGRTNAITVPEPMPISLGSSDAAQSGENEYNDSPIPHLDSAGEVDDGQSYPAISTQTKLDSSKSTWSMPLEWYRWYTRSSDSEPGVAPNPEIDVAKDEVFSHTEAVSSESIVQEPQITTSASSSTPDDANPILSSLAANRSGWVSFLLSSRSLTTKAVTERAAGGMEVMIIDESEERAEPSTAVVADEAASKLGDGATSSLSGDGSKTTKVKDSIAERPLTPSDGIKWKITSNSPSKRGASPAPSKKSLPPPTPRPPNLVLPTFHDTFRTLPRSLPPLTGSNVSSIKKMLDCVGSILFAREPVSDSQRRKGKTRQLAIGESTKGLPRAWDVLDAVSGKQSLSSCKRVVVIGVHGWFPGYAVRTVLGEPTGTSAKFSSMMATAVYDFAERQGIKFQQVTTIPLEGEGKIEHRVQLLYRNLTSNSDWMDALHAADVIFVATHSQGSIVSTHLISQLITHGHIRMTRVSNSSLTSAAISSGGLSTQSKDGQLVCCLAMCGIHMGPLAYLNKSTLVMPYIQYFESEAAAELFEFQHTESRVSREYMDAVRHALDNGVKFVYVASLNDQVVPVYSGAFSCVTHPLILRALYIDGDAYHSSDFLSNLLVLLLRIRNAGLSDGGLLAHLSGATAGSLSGVGHSTAYEELATYALAVDYLFLTNNGVSGSHDLEVEPFNARSTLNDYEIPWALRDLTADEKIGYIFSEEIARLRDAFDDWQPRTTILRDLKRKLEPIRKLKISSRL